MSGYSGLSGSVFTRTADHKKYLKKRWQVSQKGVVHESMNHAISSSCVYLHTCLTIPASLHP